MPESRAKALLDEIRKGIEVGKFCLNSGDVQSAQLAMRRAECACVELEALLSRADLESGLYGNLLQLLRLELRLLGNRIPS